MTKIRNNHAASRISASLRDLCFQYFVPASTNHVAQFVSRGMVFFREFVSIIPFTSLLFLFSYIRSRTLDKIDKDGPMHQRNWWASCCGYLIFKTKEKAGKRNDRNKLTGWVFHVNSKCPQRNKVAQNLTMLTSAHVLCYYCLKNNQ